MNAERSTLVEFSVPELSNDLIRLLDHPSHFSDAVLKCDGVEIPVHKCILSARSPVFAAMFHSQMQEGKSGNVDIVDIELSVLQVMLRYLYSGKIDSLDTVAEDLLAAADKYRLEDLKCICIDKLKSILSVDYIFRVLILGDMHDIRLKAHAKEFICKCKFSDLEETEEWELLQAENPKLAIEVLKSIVKYVGDPLQQRKEETYKIAIKDGDETISLDVKGTDSIQNIKKKIQDQQGVSSNEQKLFATVQLQDSWTLSEYKIQELNLIHPIEIFVQTLTNQAVALHASIRRDSIFYLSFEKGDLITLVDTTDPYLWNGEFNGAVGWFPSSSVHVLNKSRIPPQNNRKTFTLQVESSSTIEVVKKMIEDKQSIPVQDQLLVLNCRKLEDKVSLSSYKIKTKTTVFLVPTKKR